MKKIVQNVSSKQMPREQKREESEEEKYSNRNNINENDNHTIVEKGKNEEMLSSPEESNNFNRDEQNLQYLEDNDIKDKIVVYSDIELNLKSKFSTVKVIDLSSFKKDFFSISEISARQPILIYGEACHAFFLKFEPLFQFWFKNLLTISYDTLFSICDITSDVSTNTEDNVELSSESENKFKDLLINENIIKEDL